MLGKFVVNAKQSNAEQSNKNKERTANEDFENTSCFCLKRTFFVRKWFIHLVHWPWFERLSVLVILLSCICLALGDPLDRSCTKTRCKQLKKINMFVLWFFVAEMVIKMTAMGIIGKRSYFADGWNKLDFIIVIAGIVDEFSRLQGAFLMGIRLVRVLRPLRAINRVPSIRILVTLLLEALPLLGNVFALAFLVLFIFGIVGVQLWQGVLRNRCFLNSSMFDYNHFVNSSSCYYQLSFDQPDFLCSLPSDSGTQDCSAIPSQVACWSHQSNHCHITNKSTTFDKNYFTCLQEGPNPFYTTVSFDHIGYAWMVIFQIITLEGWTNIMYLIQQAYGYWNWIYFVILILIGPFFLVNLCLVVLAMQFQETKSRELQLLEEDRKRKIEAQKVFKGTKWAKVMNVVKTNLSESLRKPSSEHVHHHHHFHHYYHHKHVFQTPTSPAPVPIATADVFVSHKDNPVNTSPTFYIDQEPNDSIISLELTSNCKISKNFISPTIVPGRTSPTWSLSSTSSVFSEALTTQIYNDPPNMTSASATVSVNVSSGKVGKKKNGTRTDVFASAGATASAPAAQVFNRNQSKGKTLKQKSQETKPNGKTNTTSHEDLLEPTNGHNPCEGSCSCSKGCSTIPRIESHKNADKTLDDILVSTPGQSQCAGNASYTSSSCLTIPGQESDKNTGTIRNEIVVATHDQNQCKRQDSCRAMQYLSPPTNIQIQSTDIKLKTLDASLLQCDTNEKGKNSPKEVYRRKSYCGLSVMDRKTLSVPERERSESQGSLDDRFGSMFDIQRYASYNVTQEISYADKCRDVCGRVANSSIFINFIMVVIIINTILMATEHYEQVILRAFAIYLVRQKFHLHGFIGCQSRRDDSNFLDRFLETSNLIFISIFFLELVIKIIGEGIRAYVSQWFNIFDGFIVIISIIEVIVLRGSGGLSVLRSIRLLRIFRLIRPIRHQLIVMIHTMASVVTFTALLFLFIFTFAVLGMNLFGGKMFLPTVDCKVENVRSHFDSFFAAIVTIFQVLTLEDWNIVMQNAMRSTTHWAAIYFITLTIIGYYVLFNLLVAILVEGFTNPLVFDANAIKEEEEQKRVPHQKTNETAKSSDWLDLIKRAKEQPMKDKLEDDVNNSLDTDHVKTRDFKSTSETPASSSTYCSAAMRGVIGKPYKLQTIFNENSQKLPSTNPKSTKNENISQKTSRPVDSVQKSPSPSLRNFKQSLSSKNSSQTHDSSLDHYFSGSNKGFIKESSVSKKLSKPKIVITSTDEMDKCETPQIEKKEGADKNVESTTTTLDINSKSLFIFSNSNKFRRYMIKTSTSKWFDNFILFLILVSCVFMILDKPGTSSEQTKLTYTASFVFTVLFTLEVIIKVVAKGLVIGSETYLRYGWNVLDFLIVIVSWLHVIITSFSTTTPGVLGSLKVLRGLRTLRPLRMIRRAPGLKLVVEALLRSLKPIGNTVLIAAIFFIVFGVLGIQLFKGTFYHCDGDLNVVTKEDCLKKNVGEWVNRPYNFDNLAQALVTLFVLATRDGWVTIMHHGVDAVGINCQPRLNHNEWRAIYFVSFLMVVGFLVLNMVVGIVVNNYQLCQEKQEQTEKRIKQNKHKDEEIVIEDKSKNVPQEELHHFSPFRTRCFRLCNNKYWDVIIAFVICVNVILMALEHYKMSKNYKVFLDVNNYICTAIFIAEAFIKLTAFGFHGYFRDRWNILDFLVVLLSVVGIILDLVHNNVKLSLKPTVIRGLRVLRIIRVFKLFKVAKGVRSLLDTIMKSLPQVANLGLLLFLLFFIYSSLGIQLFGSIECSGQYVCHGLDAHANFHDFQTAMLTLFRVATGDNWNTIYMDTLRSSCDSSASCEKNCCYSKYLAPVYFTTFVLATHFVLLNVLVAVLMKDLKASREHIAAAQSRESLDKRVLKMTLSATKFVKEKAFSKKLPSKQEIELKDVRTEQLTD